ncbi:MAG: hypothetical protein BWY76_01991 [bacterium ADurb.Bin429]|nr:MAG: hypothetical protein BWY76_01991 [bacterium ADurb.Bin429]
MADAGINYLIWRQKWGMTDGSLTPLNPHTALSAGYNLRELPDDESHAPVVNPLDLGDLDDPNDDEARVWLFNYTVDAANGYEVVAVGAYRGYTRMVRAILQGAGNDEGSGEPPPIPPAPPIFDYALFSGSNLTLSGNANVTGSIGTNGNFTGSGNMVITQDVNAAGSVKISGSNVIIGNTIHYGTTFQGKSGYVKTNDGKVYPFPTMDLDGWKAAAQRFGGVHNGNLSISSTTEFDSPIVYVKGDVTFSGQSTILGKVTIIAEGSVHFSGQLESNPAPPSDKSNIVIMAANGVTFSGQTNVNAIVYAHNVNLDSGFLGSGQATVYGAVIADSVSGSGQFTITYRTPDTYTEPPPSDGGEENDSQYEWNVASWEPI